MIRRLATIASAAAAMALAVVSPAQAQTQPSDELPLDAAAPALAVLERTLNDAVLEPLLAAGDAEALTALIYASEPVAVASLQSGGAGSFTIGDLSIWATPVFNTRDDDDPTLLSETETRGVSAGLGWRAENGVSLGASLSVLEQDWDSQLQASALDRSLTALAGYVSTPLNAHFTLRGGGSYAWTDSELSREPFPGLVLTGETDGASWSVFGDLSGRRRAGDWTFTGAARLTRSGSSQDAYVESSGLMIAARDSDRTAARLSGVAGRLFRLERRRFIQLSGGLAWDAELSGDSVAEEDGLAARASVAFLNRAGLTASLTATRAIARDDVEETKLSGALRWRF